MLTNKEQGSSGLRAIPQTDCLELGSRSFLGSLFIYWVQATRNENSHNTACLITWQLCYSCGLWKKNSALLSVSVHAMHISSLIRPVIHRIIIAHVHSKLRCWKLVAQVTVCWPRLSLLDKVCGRHNWGLTVCVWAHSLKIRVYQCSRNRIRPRSHCVV